MMVNTSGHTPVMLEVCPLQKQHTLSRRKVLRKYAGYLVLCDYFGIEPHEE